MGTSTDIAAVQRFFETQESRLVLSAYVFGSTARGTQHEDSDVDIAVLLDRVLLPTRRARTDERVRLTSGIIAALHRNDVDLVVLNDVSPGIGRHAITQGVRVFCRSEEADHNYVRDIQLRAADLDPFLRRMRKIKLQALSA